MDYYVYIVKCSDDTFYVGITNDLKKRMTAHNRGQGAKYTRGRTPVELVYRVPYADRSQASRAEYRLKQLTHQQKKDLVEGCRNENDLF